MSEALALLPEYGTAHLRLVLVALGLGVAISVPLGVWVSRNERIERPVLGIASTLQTIPGLALLALMVPALAALSTLVEGVGGSRISSIGFVPAAIALTLYSLLPILRNTVTGLAGVDPALIEAARGVGMSPRQQLLRVELPLALPVVAAGIRTATVWVVGTATLATPVGATSLGNYIFSGLQTRNFAAVAFGSVSAALLALFLDAGARALEGALRDRSRPRLIALALGLVLLVGVSLLPELAGGDARTRVAIGGKPFTEQYILAELIASVVEADDRLRAERVDSLGSTVAFDALVAGDLDVYVDYSGTIWATILERDTLPEDRGDVLGEVERALADDYGVEIAAVLGFENTYALAMREDHASALGLTRISDLGPRSPELSIGGDYEFFARAEWAALEDRYQLAFAAERAMDSNLMYSAVESGDVDVISAYSTDGRIAAFDLRLLDDDRGVIPPYDAIVLVNAEAAATKPGLREALSRLRGRIDASAMQRLNAAVDLDGRAPAEVARAFYARLRGR